MELVVTETQDGDDVATSRAGLVAFNEPFLGPSDRRPLIVTARSEGVLHAAEAEAFARGCGAARVETKSFQARPFQDRSGYRVCGTVDDLPRGHVTHHLMKALGP